MQLGQDLAIFISQLRVVFQICPDSIKENSETTPETMRQYAKTYKTYKLTAPASLIERA